MCIWHVTLSRQRKECALKMLDKQQIMAASQAIYLKRECVCFEPFCSPMLGYYYDVVISPSKIFFSLEYCVWWRTMDLPI